MKKCLFVILFLLLSLFFATKTTHIRKASNDQPISANAEKEKTSEFSFKVASKTLPEITSIHTVTENPEDWFSNIPHEVLSVFEPPEENSSGLIEICLLELESDGSLVRIERYESPFPSTRIMKADSLLALFEDRQSLFRYEKQFPGSIIRKVNSGEHVLAEIFLENFRDPMALGQRIQLLYSWDTILFAEPNFLHKISRAVPNDELFHRQGYLDYSPALVGIDAVEGWDIQKSAHDVIIAILDTGIRLTHEDLVDNLWSNPDETENGEDSDNNGHIDDIHGFNVLNPTTPPVDDNGHGTAMAGLVGAVSNNATGGAGVAWDLQLMPIKTHNADGLTTSMDAVLGIEYAINEGAHIVNASWSGLSYSTALKEAIEACDEAGVLFVTSAGNEARDLEYSPSYPATFQLPNLICVSSVDASGGLSDFSNFSSRLSHISAPGEQLFSTAAESDDHYEYISGTSTATALVSGVATLLLAKENFESAADLKYRILTTANLLPNASLKSQTNGILNLNRALRNTSNVPGSHRFNDPELLKSPDSVELGKMEQSGFEENEPRPDPNAVTSQWYAYIPERDHLWKMEVLSSSHPVDLNLYVIDSESNFDYIPIGDIFDTELPSSILPAVADQTYYIQFTSATTDNYFTFLHQELQGNDNFRNAELVHPPIQIGPVSNRSASWELDEPDLLEGAGKTLWWRIDRSNENSLFISADGSDPGTVLSIFQGSNLSRLSLADHIRIPQSGPLEIPIHPSGPLWIRADNTNPAGGGFQFSVYFPEEPSITFLPQNQKARIGDSIDLSIGVSGTGPYQYNWYKNGNLVQTSDQPELLLEALEEQDFGTYEVGVVYPGGILKTNAISLTRDGEPPSIVLQPESKVIHEGTSLELYSRFKGAGPIRYQWYLNNEPVDGATTDSLVVNSANQNHAGLYSVTASNPFGSVESKNAIVEVFANGDLLELDIQRPSRSKFARASATFKGQFVLGIGYPGKIATSPNGYSWSKPTVISQEGVQDFASNHERIVALLTGNKIAASTDLVTWEETERLTNDFIGTSVFSFKGKFFTTIDRNRIISSEDGINWETAFSFVHGSANLLLTANENYLLVVRAERSETRFARSADGSTWESWILTPELSFYDSRLSSVGDKFILKGNRFWVSDDGESWEERDWLPFVKDWEFVNGVYYLTTEFGGIYSSTDLNSWEEMAALPYNAFDANLSLEHLNGNWIAGPINSVFFPFKSIDFLRELEDLPAIDEATTWGGMRYINNEFIRFSDQEISTSQTGLNWQPIKSEPRQGYSWSGRNVVHGNGLYLASEYYGPSLDQLSFNASAPSHLTPQVFGNGRFVGTSNDGLVYSEDGVTWMPATIEDYFGSGRFIYANDRFIGIETRFLSRFLITSTDGITWSKTDLSRGMLAVAYGNGKYIILKDDGHTLTSSDLANWSLSSGSIAENRDTNIISANYYDIIFAENEFIVLEADGIFRSSDGEQWKFEDLSKSANELTRLTYGNGVLFATGNNGQIVKIGNISNYPPTVSLNHSDEIFLNPIQSVKLSINAFDLDGRVTAVRILEGDTELATLTQEPYHWERSENPSGISYLTIIAEDDGGYSSRTIAKVIVSSDDRIDLINGTSISEALEGVTFNGSFFALSDSNSIYQASELGDWRLVFKAPNKHLESFKAEGGRLFAIAQDGYYLSEDGFNWDYYSVTIDHPRYFKKSGYWYRADITIGKRRGEAISADGRNWEFITDNNQSFDILGVTGKDLYISIWQEGFYQVLRDGKNLETVALPAGIYLRNFLEYKGGYLMEVVDPGKPNGIHILRSLDLKTWESIPSPAGISTIRSMAAVEDLVFVFANDGLYVSGFESFEWKWIARNPSEDLSHTNYFKGFYYTVADQTILRSQDGNKWTKAANNVFARGPILINDNGLLVLDGASEPSGFWSSRDGVHWQREAVPPADKNGYFQGMTHGHAGYVVSSDASIGHSTDGFHWNFQDNPWNIGGSAAFGNGVYIISGGKSSVLRSTDAVNWSSVSVETNDSYDVRRVTFLNGANLFVMQGAWSYWTSPDGTSWTKHEAAVGQSSYEEPSAVGDTVYMRIDGSVWSSQDALNWTEVPRLRYSSTITPLPNGGFIAHGAGGNQQPSAVQISSDGKTWEDGVNPATSGQLVWLDNHGSFVVGCFGTYGDECWKTMDGTTWEPLPEYSPTGVSIAAGDFVFFLGQSIQVVQQLDLKLDSANFPQGTFGVGDKIEVNITLTNSGSGPVDLEGIEVEALLGIGQGWDLDRGSKLQPSVFQHKILQPRESVSRLLEFFIPDKTLPGEYGLQLWLNANQHILEASVANNFLWSDANSIEVEAVDLSITNSPGGHAYALPGGGRYSKGQSVGLFAFPDPGYVFTYWRGEVDQPFESNAQITLTGNKDIQAVFTKTLLPELKVVGHGSISISPEKKVYLAGDSIVLEAHAESGWSFGGWDGDAASKEPSIEVEIGEKSTFTALFQQPAANQVKHAFPRHISKDESISGLLEDPDRDNYPNLIEILASSNPLDPRDQPQMLLDVENGSLDIRFFQNSLVSDYEIVYEQSEDLQVWTRVEGDFQILESWTDRQLIKTSIPTPSSNILFVRMKARERAP